MPSLGGSPAHRSGAIVLALALLLGACGDGGGDVSSDDARAREREEASTTTGDGGGREDDEVRAGRTSTTTSTTSTTTSVPTTTTTAAPPPTAAPTTAPPPPTTAPPPPPPTSAPPPPPPPPPSGPRYGTRNTGCEQYMYGQINGARSRVGRPALTFDTGIQHIAIDWSDEMARTQTLRHNPSYGDQILRYRNYRTAGENVGRGYEQGSLFQAFMDSPGHRANIESGAYSHVTVGCLTDGSGQLWVTQNFWGG